VFGVVALVLPSRAAHAVEYGGLGGKPANPDPKNARSSSIFIYTLAGGKSKQDAVRVVNNSSEAKTVEVYATDSELASGGSFACTQKADDQKQVGSWIEFDSSEVTLAASSEQTVGFRINVPKNTDVGEHNGCIVIQEKGAAPEAAGNGVALSFRSAIRTVVTVPGEITKNVDFKTLKAVGQNKKYVITAALLNTGNVSLDTNIDVTIKNLFGQQVYKNGGIYPILSQKQPIELNFEYDRPFWGGIYYLAGTAAYNSDTKIALGAPSKPDVSKKAPTSFLFTAPQPLAWLVYLLVLTLIAAAARYAYSKLRKQKHMKKTWVGYTVKSSDTIYGLAKRRGTSWKSIAKVNKLKAPYELKTGATIKLPKSDQETDRR